MECIGIWHERHDKHLNNPYPYKPDHDVSLYLKDGLWTALEHKTGKVITLGFSPETPGDVVIKTVRSWYNKSTVELI